MCYSFIQLLDIFATLFRMWVLYCFVDHLYLHSYYSFCIVMGILLSDIKILQLYFKKVSIVLLILDTYSNDFSR